MHVPPEDKGMAGENGNGDDVINASLLADRTRCDFLHRGKIWRRKENYWDDGIDASCHIASSILLEVDCLSAEINERPFFL